MKSPDKHQRLIEVLPYNTYWPLQFEQEAQALMEVLGDNCMTIHHIGSTAIPGLAAKPIIDILAVVQNLLKVDEVNPLMLKLGYKAQGEYGIPSRRYFQKEGYQRTHQAHIFEMGNPEIERYLKFRDWLRSHSEDRENYAILKLKLAQQYPNDIDAYCLGKEKFIASINKKT